ncbi:MAG: conjugal transfer protein [Actinomycetota bacterium]
MDTRTVDPRLEAELADLLVEESRPHWVARVASFVAVPTAVALLAALAAVPLLKPEPTRVVLAPPPASPVVVEPAPTPTTPPAPTPEPSPTLLPEVEPGSPEWLDAAQGLASAFAVDYLGWSQLPEVARATALSRYLAPGVDPTAGWLEAGQLVAATPIVVATALDADDQATVTVAVRVTGLEAARWIHLAVPIGRDDADGLAVVDLPRLVSAPVAGVPQVSAVAADPELVELLRSVVEATVVGHLQALQAETGFEATEWSLVSVSRLADGAATGRVEVQLTDTVTGGRLTQALHVDLVERDGGWEVTRIR